MQKFKSFETARLILKPTDLEDAEFILELLNSPKWIQNIGDRNVKTIADAQNYISTKIIESREKYGFSNFTVIRKEDNSKLGSCGLYIRDGLDFHDIGFAFLPQFEKNGYAFEAANRIKQAAFEEFGLKKILAITIKENIDSQKLLEKIGLKPAGKIKIPNDDEELLLYEATQ